MSLCMWTTAGQRAPWQPRPSRLQGSRGQAFWKKENPDQLVPITKARCHSRSVSWFQVEPKPLWPSSQSLKWLHVRAQYASHGHLSFFFILIHSPCGIALLRQEGYQRGEMPGREGRQQPPPPKPRPAPGRTQGQRGQLVLAQWGLGWQQPGAT